MNPLASLLSTVGQAGPAPVELGGMPSVASTDNANTLSFAGLLHEMIEPPGMAANIAGMEGMLFGETAPAPLMLSELALQWGGDSNSSAIDGQPSASTKPRRANPLDAAQMADPMNANFLAALPLIGMAQEPMGQPLPAAPLMSAAIKPELAASEVLTQSIELQQFDVRAIKVETESAPAPLPFPSVGPEQLDVHPADIANAQLTDPRTLQRPMPVGPANTSAFQTSNELQPLLPGVEQPQSEMVASGGRETDPLVAGPENVIAEEFPNESTGVNSARDEAARLFPSTKPLTEGSSIDVASNDKPQIHPVDPRLSGRTEKPSEKPQADVRPRQSGAEIHSAAPRALAEIRPVIGDQKARIEERTVSSIVAPEHKTTSGIPTIGKLGSDAGSGDLREHQGKPQTADIKSEFGYIPTTFSNGNPVKFEAELAEAPQLSRTAAPEMPWFHAPQMARRVSIDVGDDDSNVRITIHERAGDISIKFDAQTENLRADLQSSVGSLIEALRREQVPLANLDFTNTMTGQSDQHGTRRDHQKVPRRTSVSSGAEVTELDSYTPRDTININA